MKKIGFGRRSQVLCIVIGSLLISFGCRTGKLPVSKAAFTDTTLLFEPDRDGYTIFHVPAMVISQRGVLLSFVEGRTGNGGDDAEIDLLMRRSTDGGKTWEPSRILVPRERGKPTSNLTPIADKDGTVHLLYHVGYATAYYIKSLDDGKTWSQPVDITYVFDQFKSEYNWKVLAPGPGHAIQLHQPKHRGRLVVPVWLCEPNPKIPGGNHRPSCVATIYSDDSGKTWKRGAIAAHTTPEFKHPNESMAIELADGRVMLNMRNESVQNRRMVSFSDDGASNWSKPVFHDDLFEPVCMASMVRVSGNDKPGRNRILFVNPDSRNNQKVIRPGQQTYRPRENLTARLSYDEGKTWPVQKVLHATGSGYSDLAIGNDGTLYCLYQIRDGNDNDWKYRIVIRRFNLAWLTDGKDTGN